MIRPPLRYPGAKWRMAPLIASLLEQLPHQIYLEPFFGSGAVFFTKQPSRVELANDKDLEVTNLFSALRENPDELVRLISLTPYAETEWRESSKYDASLSPLERARRFLVRAWMSHAQRLGSGTGWAHDGVSGAKRMRTWLQLPDRLLACVERLRQVQFFCRDALELLTDYCDIEVALYVDPPYPITTRCEKNLYRCEMKTDAEHAKLLALLVAHPGPVILSGYTHPLYEEQLRGWTRLEVAAVAEKGKARTEVLWINRVLASPSQGKLL